jgi:hypothetical protein
MPFQHYKKENFEKFRVLKEPQKWRVRSNLRFEDIKNKVLKDPEATVHVCMFCGSTSFQLHEIKPPRARKDKKLVASCLGCGEWYNLDKYNFQ